MRQAQFSRSIVVNRSGMCQAKRVTSIHAYRYSMCRRNELDAQISKCDDAICIERDHNEDACGQPPTAPSPSIGNANKKKTMMMTMDADDGEDEDDDADNRSVGMMLMVMMMMITTMMTMTMMVMVMVKVMMTTTCR